MQMREEKLKRAEPFTNPDISTQKMKSTPLDLHYLKGL